MAGLMEQTTAVRLVLLKVVDLAGTKDARWAMKLAFQMVENSD